MELVPIAPDHLTRDWPFLEPWAEKFAARYPDDWPVDAIMEAAYQRTLQLWAIIERSEGRVYGMAGTRVVVLASGRRMLRVLVAGEYRKRWLHLRHVLERYAEGERCVAVEFEGRFGWADDLPDYHCRHVAIFTKKLDGKERHQKPAQQRASEGVRERRTGSDGAVGADAALP